MQKLTPLFVIIKDHLAAFFTLVLFTGLATQTTLAAPADDFVTTWKTDNPGTSNDTSITVPMVGGPYEVDWNNDGVADESGLNGSVTHDFGVAGTYTIRIRGFYDSIRFRSDDDKDKILSLDQWGTNQWTTMALAFSGASNLTIPAPDNPDFSAVRSMESMFGRATSANPDTSGWNTAAVTSMFAMFSGATAANPDTSAWDTSAVTDMYAMFSGATAANPDTSGWDTSRVRSMTYMFFGTSANPVTSGWDTSAVRSMESMFGRATSANPDTSSWDTSAVTNMGGMFSGATAANPDTSGWDTSAVTNMWGMFEGATSFDQDIGSWNVTALTDATNMFRGVTLSTANYESLLFGWNAQDLQPGVRFSGGNSTYCTLAAKDARDNMISSDSWEITDGGQQLCPPTDDFVTTWKTDNPGTSNDISITVPMVGGPYEVDWNNDGVADESGLNGSVTHDFGVAGTYTIRIRGFYDSIRIGDGGDKDKILSLDQWGTNQWMTMTGAFRGASNLTIPAPDNPDFSAVTDMWKMFEGATSANPGTGSWDTTAVTDMSFMFNGATAANPDTSGWNTAAVTSMFAMFSGATAANPDTGGWDTSAVTNMRYMFEGATSANPDTGGWNTSMVLVMTSMFEGATSFDQDIGSWNVTALTDATDMFKGVTLSTANYDSLLIGWNAQALQLGVTFDGGNSNYCTAAAIAARDNMIDSDYWTIIDGGQPCPPTDDFVTTWKTDNPGDSDDTSITVPMIGGPYEVDWNNDGVSDEFGLSDSVTHDFGVADTYTIRIRGFYDSIRFADGIDFYDGGDKDKILSLDQWGTNQWTTMLLAFWGASNLTIPAPDNPDFSAVTGMWKMFEGATSANPDTSGWDTSAVRDMRRTFLGATSANPDTSGWDTSAVLSMQSMFEDATSANPDTSGWDTSSVWYMDRMFKGATSFDQDIGSWNVTTLTDATDMFLGVTMSIANYDSLLIGWNAQALQPDVIFSGGDSTFCTPAAADARANMITSDSWVITDGGQICSELIFSSGFESGE